VFKHGAWVDIVPRRIDMYRKEQPSRMSRGGLGVTPETGRVAAGDVGARIVRIIGWILIVGWSIFSIFAFAWVVMTSLKSNHELFTNVWSLPKEPQWSNYVKVWTLSQLGTGFANSMLLVLSSVAVLVVVASPAAYVLARKPFKGSDALTNFFTFGMGIPSQLLLVPLFFLMFKMKLVDSLFGLAIVYVALSLPFTIFYLVGFFRTLPGELEEAAMIDGCTSFQAFSRIMLPLASPGVLTVSIFNFLFLWNDFLLALTFLSSNDKFTLSLGLFGLKGTMQYTGDWVGLFAGFTLIMLPILIVYLFLSNQMVEGLTAGATKG